MDRLQWIETCAWRDAHRILELESEELQIWAQGLTGSARYAQVQAQLEILREGPVNQAMLEKARRQRLQKRYRGRQLRQPHVGATHWKADGTAVVISPPDCALFYRSSPTTFNISDLPPLP